MKRHVKNSKYDSDVVEEVEQIETNPQYAHVKLNNVCESTESNRHLAPTGDSLKWGATDNNEKPIGPNKLNTSPPARLNETTGESDELPPVTLNEDVGESPWSNKHST